VEPPPYLTEVATLIARREPELWRWFAGTGRSAAEDDALRLDLLKHGYRLDRAAHGRLHERLAGVAARLGVTAPITCYQAQAATGGLYASIAATRDELHLLLHGPLAETLDDAELDAVLAHELGHHLLWTHDGGRLGIADRILAAAAGDDDASAAVATTWRRWRLATELGADRAALTATGDLAAAVRALVRTLTGGTPVDADAYLAQAAEILARGGDRSAGITHPEPYLRAQALAWYAADGAAAEARIAALVIGPLDPHDLDLSGQERCTALTRALLCTALAPTWQRSAAVLAHAARFFPDLEPGDASAELDAALSDADAGLRDYVVAVLLDVAAADRALGEPALAHALLLAARWGCADALATMAERDLPLPAAEVARVRAQAPALVARAAAQAQEQAQETDA
jgi:hypothetical protein